MQLEYLDAMSYLLIISTFWSRELSWLFQDSMWVWKLSQRLALAARPDTPPFISDTESQVRSENGKWLSFNILSDLLMHWPSNSVRKELGKSENIF